MKGQITGGEAEFSTDDRHPSFDERLFPEGPTAAEIRDFGLAALETSGQYAQGALDLLDLIAPGWFYAREWVWSERALSVVGYYCITLHDSPRGSRLLGLCQAADWISGEYPDRPYLPRDLAASQAATRCALDEMEAE